MKKELEQLKEKIQKVVPEIMELKLGCEVEISGTIERNKEKVKIKTNIFFDDYLMTYSIGRITDKYKIQRNKTHLLFYSEEGFFSVYIQKILGRPINLEDVLVAITIKHTKDCVNRDDKRLFMCSDVYATLEMWQLNKPLDEQSEETIKFLNKLL